MAEEPRDAVPPLRIRRMTEEEIAEQRRLRKRTDRRSVAAVSPPSPPSPSPTPPPSPTKPESREPSAEFVADSTATGAWFASGSGMLAYLGALAGSGLVNEATLLRSPGGAWWSQAAQSCERAAPLVLAAGGRPFARVNGTWVAMTANGQLPDDPIAFARLSLADWVEVNLADLIVQSPLLPGRLIPTAELHVVVPGPLGRWVLQRAAALEILVEVVPCVLRPLRGAGPESGGLRIRLRADRGTIPPSLIYSFCNLPYVIVGEPTAGDGGRLLVNQRQRLAFPPRLLSRMIPEGETWVLGPPDVGSWRLQPTGAEIDGSLLLAAPTLTSAPAPVQPLASVPDTIEIKLVPRRGRTGRVNAVLLDDEELRWLRTYLAGRPAGEISFLYPGAGRHLLTAPGGLPGDGLPFGTPLVRVGPGGLYLELGQEFHPPLPVAARQACFELNEDTVVAVVAPRSAYRFITAHLTPAWSLWVGEPPQVESGLSIQGQKILNRISDEYRKIELMLAQRDEEAQRGGRRPRAGEQARLLDQALQAERADRLFEAAELLERAGYPGQAGRLYERAAGALRK